MPIPSLGDAREALTVRESRIDPALLARQEGSAGNPSGQYDFEFGIPYNAKLRHLTGSEFELREFTREEREEIWKRAHQAWERNPWAKNAVRTIRAYVTGTGHTMTYRAQAVKEILEAFRTDPENAVEQYDKQLCEQLLIDGELFIRFTEPAADESDTPKSARLVIDPVPPWWVLAIKTDPNFRKRITGYVIQFSVGEMPETAKPEDEPKEVDPTLILHVAINKLAYEQRGRSELLAILPWLKALKDFIEDRARLNRFKGNIYFHLNLEGATAAQVSAARQQYKVPPPPASILVTGGKQTFAAINPQINASDAKEDGRAIRLASAVGFGLPEFMYAGDAAESNLATAQAQMVPTERNFEDYRDILANQLWRPIYRRVLELAARAGVLGAKADEQGRYMLPEIDADGEPVMDRDNTPKMVDAFEAFDLAYPPLKETDPKTLADALHLLMADRLLSRVSAQERAGIDPQIEAKRLAAEDDEDQARIGQGLGIPGGNDDELPSLGRKRNEPTADDDDDQEDEK